MMNVLKFNVGNRRRILKKTPIVQQSSLYLFSPSNRLIVFFFVRTFFLQLIGFDKFTVNLMK